MKIEVVPFKESDIDAVFEIQRTAYLPLYEKYHDNGNPYLESRETVIQKYMREGTEGYLFVHGGTPVGAVRIRLDGAGRSARVSALCVLPEFQGNGIAQRALHEIERLHPEVEKWFLDTILEEPGNCHLYEKLGYRKTGKTEAVSDRMTLVCYENTAEQPLIRPSVTLEQMLDARERRAAAQKELLKHADGTACLVSLSLNIAGDVKRTPKTRFLFDRAMKTFGMLGFPEITRQVTDAVTGTEALILLDADASAVKQALERLEDSFPAGRLCDFDVLNASGEKLSRSVPRKCLVCGGPAAVCVRSRAHGLDAVKKATETLLDGFAADTLAHTAHVSLIRELHTTPKPGLVDEANSGAHTDMDVPLFEKSAASLVPYFRQAVLTGISGAGMAALKAHGLDAERAMFEATGGVNTHKGIVYSMGLLLCGMGRALETGCDAIEAAAELARTDAESRLSEAVRPGGTHGGAVYRKTGVKGAVGEASEGFPHAVFCSERLAYYASIGAPEPGALALCDTMAVLPDTNVLHRGGTDGLAFVQSEAKRIASLPVADRMEALAGMDLELIRRNLSPGGSADVLALAYLLNAWRDLSGPLFSLS